SDAQRIGGGSRPRGRRRGALRGRARRLPAAARGRPDAVGGDQPAGGRAPRAARAAVGVVSGWGSRGRGAGAAPLGRVGARRRLGQGVLWLLVLVLLVRGLADLLERREPTTIAPAHGPAHAAWPHDEAQAFGAAFARAYMTTSPHDAAASAGALAPFVSP